MNSKIYLAKNIKLDKNYKAVLNYSESDMLSLITDQNNLVYTESNAQFIRDTKSIIVKGKYNACIQANYMAFSNPDYSNKWFFAFIDEVIFKGDNNTEIKYTIDIFSTWHDYWTPKACFVEREHVISDDYAEHTVPENLETGEYVVNYQFTSLFGGSHVVMGTTISPVDGTTKVTGGNYGGVYSGVKYFIFEDENYLNSALGRIASNGNSDSIISLFYCPDFILGITPETVYTDGIKEVPSTSLTVPSKSVNIPIKPLILDGYTFKNRKCATYPYVGYLVSNNAGGSILYRLEDFGRDTDPNGIYYNVAELKIYGSCTPGVSIRLLPKFYKIPYESGESNAYYNNEYGLTGAKFPIASWGNDTYTNWLTNQGVDFGFFKLNAREKMTINSLLSFNPMRITESVSQIQQHEFNSIEASGNINSGDVTYALGRTPFTGFLMSCKKEYLQIIDQYFTRMGYRVNTIKIPNMSNRENYNYVKISQEENVVYPNNHNNICLPATALNEINNLFRNGITIWNNHTNFGDYSVSNNITT